MNSIKILVPGSFKPLHGGHIHMISELLKGINGTPTDVYVIFSDKPREGFCVTPSMDFLKDILGRKNLHLYVTSESPVKEAYNMAATKQFGDGTYAMAASNKDNDIKRSLNFYQNFKPGGKYYTPGVDVMMLDPIETPVYTKRDDDLNYTPISSTVVRDDVKNSDYDNFLAAFEIYDGFCKDHENTLERYYDTLLDNAFNRSQPTVKMNETAAAGHINHPYDDTNMTFGDLKSLIDSIFKGELEDITEKLDGINLFASVDDNGKVIFARNKRHIFSVPMYRKDMENHSNWNEATMNSFLKGADVIEKVFSHIKNPVKFFNYDDKLDGLKYRTWVSVEIIDNDNMNVIPYVENFVSFHTRSLMTACIPYDYEFDIKKDWFEDPNMVTDSEILEKAIKETNAKDGEFKASITPSVIIRDNGENGIKLQEYTNELVELMDEYDLNDQSTIADYKYNVFYRYIRNNVDFKRYITDELSKDLASKWSGLLKTPIKEINKEIKREKATELVRNFEKDKLKKLKKKVMMPIDKLFINIGNDIIKLTSGTKNENNSPAVIKKIKDNIVSAISAIEETGDEKDLDKLEYILFRLGDTTDINASEGIVFRWHGGLYKLTGSFSVLNQVMMLDRNVNRHQY